MLECAEKLGKAGACPPVFRAGNVPVHARAILAPMSGVTDAGMRRIAMQTGAGMAVSEMVASDDYVNGRSEARLRAEGEGVSPHVVQIAGCEPYWMGEAARLAEASGADIVDINMGCPSKRVNGRFSGSALMRDLDHAVSLIEATVAAVKCPVTVKMRLGWDHATLNAPELARRAEASGAQMITVHGRTRQQFYTGRADWCAIRPVREATSVPLIANGDCTSAGDARRMLAETGADAVMVGRSAVGRPWLVGEIAAELDGSEIPPLTAEAKAGLALRHLEYLVSAMGGRTGLRHARKHLAAYADHAGSSIHDLPASLRAERLELVTSDSFERVPRLLHSLMVRVHNAEDPKAPRQSSPECAAA